MAFPQNLLRAHAGAEELRPQSIKAIEASAKLLQHADIIERTGNVFQYFGHNGPFRDDDDVVIRVLGHRAFNDLMVAANLILSGYYQSGIILARDLLELTFLLHDFSAERGNIAKWRTLHGKEYEELFKPVAIRKRLDDRDGFTSKKARGSLQVYVQFSRASQPDRLPDATFCWHLSKWSIFRRWST